LPLRHGITRHGAEGAAVSNIDRTRRTGAGAPTAPSTGTTSAPRARVVLPDAAERVTSADMPNAAGTAVLNLTVDQIVRIRVLLIAMRLGRAVADDVRSQIYNLLSGGQKRVIGAAYFILSVRA
jgi:hypothetical protein